MTEHVWVLTVVHRHGDDTTVHATEDSAQRWLHNYVKEWWHELDVRPLDEGEVPRVEEDGDLVLADFDAVEDPVTIYFEAIEDEYAEIVHTPILNIGPGEHRTRSRRMTTHDYPTRKVQGSALDETMVLVGESGGLSAVYGRKMAAFGGIAVETEHGTLFLDPDTEYDIYDERGFEDVNTADGTAIDDPALAEVARCPLCKTDHRTDFSCAKAAASEIDRVEWEWDNYGSKAPDKVKRWYHALELYKDLKVLLDKDPTPENEQRARSLQARITEEAFGITGDEEA